MKKMLLTTGLLISPLALAGIWDDIKEAVKHPKKVPERIEKQINRTDEDVEKLAGKTKDVVSEAVDDTIHILNQAGEEFEEFMCGLVGKEPNEGCNVSGGVQVNSDGDVTLTDGEGQPSEKPPKPEAGDSGDIDRDALDWLRRVELQDWEQSLLGEERRYVVGGFAMLALGEPQGVTWFSVPPGSVTKSGTIRSDGDGNPLVGARRIDNGTYRLHKGTDYSVAEGDQIFAPFSGTVITSNRMSNRPFHLIQIKGEEGIVAKILYTKGGVTIGEKVSKGQVIGHAENLHMDGGYPKSVSNHVHVEYVTPEGYSLAPNGKYAVVPKQDELEVACNTKQCYAPDGY